MAYIMLFSERKERVTKKTVAAVTAVPVNAVVIIVLKRLIPRPNKRQIIFTV